MPIDIKATTVYQDFEQISGYDLDFTRDPADWQRYADAETQEAFNAWVSAYCCYMQVEYAAETLRINCHYPAKRAGWWTDLANGQDHIAEIKTGTRFGKALVAEKLCLIHSEISEGMEGHRKNLQDDKLPHRSMLEVELADAVIRIFDLAGALGLDMGAAIAEKLAFNAQRPDHKPENRQAAGGKAY